MSSPSVLLSDCARAALHEEARTDLSLLQPADHPVRWSYYPQSTPPARPPFSPSTLPQQHDVFFFDPYHHRADNTTPWLNRGLYLDGRCLRTLAEAPGTCPTLHAHWLGPGAVTQPEQADRCRRHDQILQLILDAFEDTMDRAIATLSTTPAIISQIFHSPLAEKVRSSPLEVPFPCTVRRYKRTWRRFLCWVFRSAPLRRDQRWTLLGVPLDPLQTRIVEHIWATLEAYLLRPTKQFFHPDRLPELSQPFARVGPPIPAHEQPGARSTRRKRCYDTPPPPSSHRASKRP
ncbi:hypothetical protein GCM10020218_103810 [Dactylosporangium vinaceum]